MPRVALYYAPAENDPLHTAGASWLGRDPATNAPMRQPDVADLPALTADPRRYGFHATLKPPFRLRKNVTWTELRSAAWAAVRAIPAFALPPLAVADIGGFLALRETAPCPALQMLCDACVREVDDLRAPPDDAELARRRRAGLTDAQEAMLARWGYPHVFDAWYFHMTLTRRLTAAERERLWPLTQAHFAPALARPRLVTHVALFTQRDDDADFVIAERLPLASAA